MKLTFDQINHAIAVTCAAFISTDSPTLQRALGTRLTNLLEMDKEFTKPKPEQDFPPLSGEDQAFQSASKPWMPGKDWVERGEGSEMPAELNPKDQVTAMFASERTAGNVWECFGLASDWQWEDEGESRIVAYKVIKKNPWYPDDSGDWVEVPADCMGMPAALKPTGRTAVLLGVDRENRSYIHNERTNCDWVWEVPAKYRKFRIVAYKVLK